MEAHSGKIDVESTAAQGTKFICIFHFLATNILRNKK